MFIKPALFACVVAAAFGCRDTSTRDYDGNEFQRPIEVFSDDREGTWGPVNMEFVNVVLDTAMSVGQGPTTGYDPAAIGTGEGARASVPADHIDTGAAQPSGTENYNTGAEVHGRSGTFDTRSGTGNTQTPSTATGTETNDLNTGTDVNTDQNTNTNQNTNTEMNTGADINSGANTGTDTNTDTDTNTGAATNTGADTNTGTTGTSDTATGTGTTTDTGINSENQGTGSTDDPQR